jgi:rhodanese-related sulfurtransferase
MKGGTMSILKSSFLNTKCRSCLRLLVPFLVIGFVSAAWADSAIPQKKRTTLKLYMNARQAWERWSASPDTVHILDVRTPAEYFFVGHAPMAVNIPLKLLGNGLNPLTLHPSMPNNKNFIADVKKKFKKTDTILVMCRSGSRSTAAVNLLAREGFKKVYNIIDGFEGDALKDPDSYQNGKRIINGWKNSGAPWTYKLERRLTYFP